MTRIQRNSLYLGFLTGAVLLFFAFAVARAVYYLFLYQP